MRTSAASWLNRDKEEISCLMKLFLCPLPLWKIEAPAFHYKSVCFASHSSLVWKSKAISLRSHPWSSHLLSCLQLSHLCRYLPKSVFWVASPLALATSCNSVKQFLFLNFPYFDLVIAYLKKRQSHILYFILFPPLKSLNLLDWNFIFFFLTHLQGFKAFFFSRGREYQPFAGFLFYFLYKSTDMYVHSFNVETTA